MSNPIKLVCLDENGGDMFVVSTNTKGSTNASTGALVLNNGGFSINSTANSVSASAGGALTVAGGAAIGSDLRVGKDVYFYGNLYQNGTPFVSGSGTGGSSQWTSGTDGSVSYTSGSVVAPNLFATNMTVGALSAIGNSNTIGALVTTGGNIGIGTSSPNTRLHVVSNVTNGTITINNSIDAGVLNFHDVHHSIWGRKGFGGIGGQGSNDVMEFHEYGNFSFWTGGDIEVQTEKLRITQSGNVGIGTSSPSAKLDVSGSFAATSGTVGQFVSTTQTVGTSLITTNLLATGNSNTVGALITTGGNVGIGTSSPTTRLDVITTASNGNVLLDNINGGGVINFYDAHHSIWGRRGYKSGNSVDALEFHEVNAISFWTGGLIQEQTERLRITSDGNVGIGTTSPGRKLDVSGTLRSLGGTNLGLEMFYDNGLSQVLSYNRVNNSYLPLALIGSHVQIYNSDSLIVSVTGGNVGIGTSSPGHKLHLYNPSGFTALKISNGFDSNKALDLGVNSTSHFIYGYGDHPFIFGTNGAERMRIAGNGAVSILGTLSKGGGSFDIEHPDPVKAEEGYRLRHCFVESPTRGDNIYRFKIQTTNKIATIILPDYYDHLNENTQVFVTAEWSEDVSWHGYGRGRLNPENPQQVDIRVTEDGEYNILVIGTRKDQLMKDFWDEKGAEYIP